MVIPRYLMAVGLFFVQSVKASPLDWNTDRSDGLDLDKSDELTRRPGGSPLNNNAVDGVAVFMIVFFSFFLFTVVVSLVSMLTMFVKNKLALSQDELTRQEENQVYLELDSEEQELYFQSKDFLNDNPYYRNDLTLSQNLLIQEKGINAWEFVKDSMLTNNDLLILNKVELNFFKKFECSAQTNLPVPKRNDVYYFETKLYSLPNPENTKISIGLGIKPYPWFRLPGRHAHSVSYDSDGHRRHNQPFSFTNEPPFPKLIEGDVVGVGYRVRSGTIFFTRNGKKLSESKIGGHIKNFKIPNNGQIFPIIGANNLCSVHVNLGQLGYVFIEGNVKKWGFAPLEGSGPAPPAYNKYNSDILLERSEIDDNDLSERESDFPPDFWQAQSGNESNDEINSNDKFSYNAYSDVNSTDERITLNSLAPPNRPPSYDSEESDNEADNEAEVDEMDEGNEADEADDQVEQYLGTQESVVGRLEEQDSNGNENEEAGNSSSTPIGSSSPEIHPNNETYPTTSENAHNISNDEEGNVLEQHP